MTVSSSSPALELKAITATRVREHATKRGVRLVQHGVVLSEVLRNPGPTHSVADVLAAAAQALKPDSRIALLGFAAGGMIAPLRAMRGNQAIRSVDIDGTGFRVFDRLCKSWSGDVDISLAEAGAWLRAQNTTYDIIIEDLSVPSAGDVFKPDATWSALPGLIHARLAAGGVGVFNLLRPRQEPWDAGCLKVAQSFRSARVVHFDQFENRILIAAKKLPSARHLSLRLRERLRSIGSQLAGAISVRTFQSSSTR